MRAALRFRRFLLKVGFVTLCLALLYVLLSFWLYFALYKRFHSEVLLASTFKKFQLVVPDCQSAAPELWSMSQADHGDWKRVDGIELTVFYNCLAMPAKLYASRNEKLLFVRRSAEEDLAGLTSKGKARSGTWSDLIDVSGASPRMILSLKGCCEASEAEEKSIDEQIDKIAKENGVELKPW
jgi:hypothetical protein